MDNMVKLEEDQVLVLLGLVLKYAGGSVMIPNEAFENGVPGQVVLTEKGDQIVVTLEEE